MLEVNAAIGVIHLEQFGKEVALPPDLFDGLPWTEAELRAHRGRIDWDPYAELIDRLGTLCGSDDVIQRVGASMDETAPWLAILLRSALSPVQMLRFWERMVPNGWRNVKVVLDVSGHHRAELRAEVPSSYRGCRTFFCASATAIASTTRRIGLPALEIDGADFSTHHGVYRYALPRSRTVPARLQTGWDGLWAFLGADRHELDQALTRSTRSEPDEGRSTLAVQRWGLTPAQGRVLGHVVRGLSNKEVARALAIEEATVEVHVGQLFKRSGVRNRSSLVYAFWTLR